MPDNDEKKVHFQPKIEREDEISELDQISQGEVALGLGAERLDVVVLTDEEDLNKKNYVKITSTFYVQPVELEEDEVAPEEGEELYKILNPETGVAEKRKLTDDERREIIIKDLKDSKIHFKNVTHVGNKTNVKFNSQYKKKRQRKNKQAKASRRINRKK